MNERVRLEQVGFRYRGAKKSVLEGVSLTVKEGDRILIRGMSGSGKSTLLALMAGLSPEYITGELSGKRELLYRTKGVVLQNPEAQIVTPTVREEIAFALENQGMDPEEILYRVDEMMEALGIDSLADRHPLTLSGGECQRVSLAAALVLKPEIVFLDEPTSYLDNESARQFFDALSLLSPATSLVVVEHRLDAAARICTTAYEVREDGGLVESNFLPNTEPAPPLQNRTEDRRIEPAVLELRDLEHSWARKKGKTGLGLGGRIGQSEDRPASSVHLFGPLSLRILRGEVAALLGPSGCGKSTLIGKITGMYPPKPGTVFFQGRDVTALRKEEFYRFFMYVPQNPEHMFLAETVQGELESAGTRRQEGDQRDAWQIANRFGLEKKWNAHPFRLSEGEKRRLNLSIAFADQRSLYLLDEPTYGLDARSKSLLEQDIRSLADQGAGVLLVTHDEEFARRVADSVYRMTAYQLIREEVRTYAACEV
jgi:energy-coupling factor transport system ATP-binding protein